MNEGLILYILDVADNLAKAIGMGLIFSVLTSLFLVITYTIVYQVDGKAPFKLSKVFISLGATSFLVFLNSFFPSTEVLELWLM